MNSGGDDYVELAKQRLDWAEQGIDLLEECLPGVQEAAAVQFDTAMEQAKLPSNKVTSEQFG